MEFFIKVYRKYDILEFKIECDIFGKIMEIISKYDKLELQCLIEQIENRGCDGENTEISNQIDIFPYEEKVIIHHSENDSKILSFKDVAKNYSFELS